MAWATPEIEMWCRVACYVLSQGVCGWVSIALGVMYKELAEGSELSPEEGRTGALFLSRGVGLVLATFLGPALYRGYEDDLKLGCLLLALGFLVAAAELVRHELLLHIWFFCTGLLCGAVDVGTQILVRRSFGKQAGPWIALNLFGFSAFCILASALYFLPALWLQALVSGLLALAVGCYVIGFRAFQGSADQLNEEEDTLRWKIEWKNMEIDWLCLLAAMFAKSSLGAVSGIIYVYLSITHRVSDTEAGWLMLAFWATYAASRLATFIITYVWESDHETKAARAYNAIWISLVCGSGSALIWAAGPADDAWSFRIGLLAYALFYGPFLGLLYIISNLEGSRSDQAAAMCVLGMNIGGGLGPWIVSVGIEFVGPAALPWSMFLNLGVCTGLVMWAIGAHRTSAGSHASKAYDKI